MQNIQDWVLAVGVVVFVVIDILLLVLNLVISEALGHSELSVVPNREKLRTVTGVSSSIKSIINNTNLLLIF
jgi:hypothetical protein